MARTPLFDLLQRSLRIAHRARVTSIPVDDILGDLAQASVAAHTEAHAHRLSRRQFVTGASAAATVVALDACLPHRRTATTVAASRTHASVLVVGAGIAGLTTAYRLQQHGIHVRVIEAQERVGGRMFSLRNAFRDGQVCELGGELIDTGHTHIRALAEELGIALDDLRISDAGVDTDVWYFGGARRTHAEVIHALVPVAARLAADRATWGDDFDPTYRAPSGAEPLDRMSIAEWLDRVGVQGWIRELLNVGYTTEYGLPIDRQSALNLLTMIELRGDDFKIYGVSDERFHVHGGNDTIPHTLAQRLGGAVTMGRALSAVTMRADGMYECHFGTGASTWSTTASHVVLAIPFTTLRDVHLDIPLSEVKQRAIRELGYGKNAKLMVGFSDRVWRTQHHSNGSMLTSLPFQLTWETSRGQSGPSGILTNFTGDTAAMALANGTAEEQAHRMVRDLDQVFPGSAAAHTGMTAVRFHWPSFPWTRGSYASYLVGQWTSIRGAEGESVGQLYFAGEHCSKAAQGFMEGGCETGEQAAADILATLGISVQRPSARRLLRTLYEAA